MIRNSTFLILFFFFNTSGFALQLPKSLLKKTTKAIVKTFEVKEVALEAIVINETVQQKLIHKIGANNLFKIISNQKMIGYAYVDKALSKTDEFVYLILLDLNLIIKSTKVLVYREDYGGEIGSRRWLNQFKGKSYQDKLKYEKNIIAISGATISARAMTRAVNAFLKNIIILKENNLL